MDVDRIGWSLQGGVMPGLIAPATVEQIRAASDIVDVIGSYFPLKRAGANFTALCPFHKEKSPSFNVNPHRQIFHCFGCHKGGDVFAFVRDYENLPFVDVLKRLADRANIVLEFDNQPGQQQARHLKEQLLEIHDQIARRWQTALGNEASGQPARDYLKQRGVSEEAVELFRLGFAPEAWDDTVNWAKSKGHDLDVMEKAGLILRKEDSDRHYDRFRGRLIFPICDEQGRVIGFSGRLLNPEAKAAKYVNSPETLIFHKSKVFFGLDKSKRPILDAEFAIVCEGPLDLIACYMAGIKNMVAPQGTALTPDHARILKRYVNEVVLCFDADNAGQAAAVRALDGLLEAGLAIRVAVIPTPHDPDSYIREFGVDAFRECLDAAEGFFDFYLNRLCSTHDLAGDKGRIQVLNAMGEAVHKTRNQVLIDTYTQKTAQRLGVRPDSVRAEFKKLARVRPTSRFTSSEERDDARPESATESMALRVHEVSLVKILFDTDDLIGGIEVNLPLEWLGHPVLRKIVTRRIESHRNGAWNGLPGFLHELETDEERNLLSEIIVSPLVAHTDGTRIPQKAILENPVDLLRSILFKLKAEYINGEIGRLLKAIESPELSVERRTELQRAHADLIMQKRCPVELRDLA